MKSRFVPVGLVSIALFFSLTASVCSGADYAIDKGSDMFTLTAGFVSAAGDLYEDSEGNSYTTLLIMPGWARFAVSNIAFGGDFLLLNSKQGDTGISTLGLGPKIVCFFGGQDRKSYPFATAGLYYLRNTTDYGDRDYTVSGTRVKFGGGASIMVADHLGLLMEASYNLDNLKAEGARKSQSGNMLIVSVGLAGFTF